MLTQLINQIPLLLTLLRAFLAPIVIMIAVWNPLPVAFALCLILAILSDYFDGVIARRLEIATANLRRLDSIADSMFYVAALFAVWWLYPHVIANHLSALAFLLGLEVIRYLFDFLKFRREASYHMWSAKLWGVVLFSGFFSLLVFGADGFVVSLTIYWGILSDLEGLAISLVLRDWQSDVPTLFHALQIRRATRI